MTVEDLNRLIDLIEDNSIDVVKKLIVSEECYDELTRYTDVIGGKFKTKNNHLYYRDFKIIKEK